MDTFSFVRDIKDVPMYGKFLVSFDVESLFTNIPLEECIDLTVKYSKHRHIRTHNFRGQTDCVLIYRMLSEKSASGCS